MSFEPSLRDEANQEYRGALLLSSYLTLYLPARSLSMGIVKGRELITWKCTTVPSFLWGSRISDQPDYDISSVSKDLTESRRHGPSKFFGHRISVLDDK